MIKKNNVSVPFVFASCFIVYFVYDSYNNNNNNNNNSVPFTLPLRL